MRTNLKRLLCLLLTLCLLTQPLTAAAFAAPASNEIVVNATDYGADPSGVADSAEAIWNALEAAKELSQNGTKHVTLNFPKGEYHIYKDKAQTREYHTSNTNSIENPTKSIGILLEGQKNLTVEGNGSLFMMHGNMMALAVAKSENITLHDFAWDFAVPTVSEMTVVNMGNEGGKDYTDFYIPKCFPYSISGNIIRWSSELSPYTGKPYWTAEGIHNSYGIVAYQPDDEMTRIYGTGETPFKNVSSIRQLDDTTVRITYNGGRPSMQKKGMVLELCSNAHRETAGAFTWESKNVTADHINVHFMHGFGWLVQMSENVYYRNCDLMPRPGSGHLSVSFADGIHASGAKGEFVIENCNFAHTHDDPINMHGTFTRVERRIDDHTLQLNYIHNQQGGFPQYHVGDKVQFFTRDTLESTDGEKQYTVSEIVSNPGEKGNNLRTMVIKFEEALPDTLSHRISGEPKYVAENVTYAPSVTIRGCTFKDVATRAILCTTRNKVIIEDNVFYPTSMATIFLSNDSDQWYESGPIRDMTIRNNVFYVKDIGGRTSWPCAPAIWVHPVTKGGGLPSASNPIHKNITVEGNTFFMDEDMVVKGESVENLTFRNNKIFRMNPDVKLSVTADKNTLNVGESLPLHLTATGNQNTKDIDNLFEFRQSKNVTISGNTYDDGMKNTIVLEDEATGTTLHNEDGLTVARNRNTPAAPAVSGVRYASSNPDVVFVGADGTLTGKNPGTATVFAYYEWNDTLIRSNSVSFTVAGAASAESLTITPAEPLEVKVGETLTLTTDAEGPVTWTVSSLENEQTTDAAEISEAGVLTGRKNGIVWVKASTAAASAKVAVTVYGGPVDALGKNLELQWENKDKYTLADSAITITMDAGDLYQRDKNRVTNLLVYDPVDMDKTNLRTVVKVEGLPINESGQWDTASFVLMKDVDNYVTVGKKSHYNGIASVVEKDGTAVETHGDAKENATSTAWLGMTMKNGTITLDYKTEGGAWTQVREITDHTVGDNYKIAMGCWHSNDRGRTVTFSDFHVGSADTTYEDLCAQPAMALKKTTNDRPVVSNVQVTAGPAVAYQFADEDGEGTSLYRWNWVANGREMTKITTTKTLNEAGVTEGTCQVFPVDRLGQPGVPSEKVAFSAALDDTAELYTIAVNGSTVYQRGGKRDVTVLVPAEADKISLAYAAVNSAAGEMQIFVNDAPLTGSFAGTDTVAVAVKNGDTVKLVRGAEQYVLHIRTAALDEAKIESIAVDTLNFTQNAPFSTANVTLNAGHTASGTLTVRTSAATGSLKVLQGDYRTPLTVTATDNGYTVPVQFVNGLNTFYVTAVAQDGKTEDPFILSVVYAPNSSVQVTGITLNGKALEGFAANQNAYLYNLQPGQNKLDVAVAAQPENVLIALNGKTVNAAAASFTDLKDGANQLVIKAVADDGIATVSYKVTVVKPYDANANLQSAQLDGRDVTAQLLPGETSLLGVSSAKPVLRITAQDNRAKVTVSHLGKVVAEGTGKVEQALTPYDNANTFTVTITAVDKTTKTFTLDLTRHVYLSDLEWFSESCGWQSTQKDKNIDGSTLKMVGPDGQPVSFAKGLGTHTVSNIVYDITGKGYTAIKGYAGLDYAEYNADYGSIQFQIFADDTMIFDSGVMRQKTPMKEINAKLPEGTRKVTLKALEVEHNWNDHANWADIRFASSFGDMKVDKTELNKNIHTAEAKQETDYTASTWRILNNALAEAQRVSADAKATPDAVAKAHSALETALRGLKQYNWTGANLSISGNIGVNLYGEFAPALVENGRVVIKVDNVEVANLPVASAMDGKFTAPVAVRQMTAPIVVQIMQNGEPVGEPLTYTVRENADELLKLEDEALRNFVRTMLYHGEQMQLYKDYTNYGLAADGLNVDDLRKAAADLTVEDLKHYTPTMTGSVPGLELYGTNLDLQDETSLRYFFTKGEGFQLDHYTFTVNGQPAVVKTDDQFVCVEVANINAQSLQEMYQLKVVNGDAALTVTYGPMSYARTILANGPEAVQPVARSLVLYGNAAKAYFTK